MRDWNGGHIFRSGTHVAIKAIPKQQAGGGTKSKLSILDFSRLWRNYFGYCHHPSKGGYAKIHENTLKFYCPCSEQTRIWLSSQIPNTKQGVTEITNTLPDLLTKNAIPHNPLWNRHFRLSTRPTWRKRLNLNGCLDKETYNTHTYMHVRCCKTTPLPGSNGTKGYTVIKPPPLGLVVG